jgi:hypothetical protein
MSVEARGRTSAFHGWRPHARSRHGRAPGADGLRRRSGFAACPPRACGVPAAGLRRARRGLAACPPRAYAASGAVRRKVVPTLFWMNAPGGRLAIAWVAFQPVQWAGTITSGASCSSALTVSPMTGSNSRPVRWNPPMNRVQLADAGQTLGIAADVDHAGVAAPGENDEPAPQGSASTLPARCSQGRPPAAAGVPGLFEETGGSLYAVCVPHVTGLVAGEGLWRSW